MGEISWTTAFWDMADCLRKRKVLCDLDLVVPAKDGCTKSFPVHKLLLSLASNVLMVKMVENDLEKEIYFSNITENGLEGLVNFIYGQDIEGSQEDYEEYLQAAKVLKVTYAEKMFELAMSRTNATTTNNIRRIKRKCVQESSITQDSHSTEDEISQDNNDKESEWNSSESDSSVVSSNEASDTLFSTVTKQSLPKINLTQKYKKLKCAKTDHKICTICDAKFDNKSELHKHQKIVHSIGNPFKCNYCGKTFFHRTQYKYHLRTHTNERPHCCEQCGKTFAVPSTLKLHLETHKSESEKKFSCPQCKKKFAQKGNMERHILGRHTQEKSFVCDICGKGFHWHRSLLDHLKRHDGSLEKIFACDQCDFAFVSKYKLERHKIVHSNIKPYMCDWCGQRFTQKESMTKHKRDSCKGKARNTAMSANNVSATEPVAETNFQAMELVGIPMNDFNLQSHYSTGYNQQL